MTVSDKSIEQLANAVSNLTKTVNQTVSSDKLIKTKLEQLLEFLARDSVRKEKLAREREAKQDAKKGAREPKQEKAPKKASEPKKNEAKKQSEKKEAEALKNVKAQGEVTKKTVNYLEDSLKSLDDRKKKPDVKSKEMLERLKKSGELPKAHFDKICEISDLLLESVKLSESIAKPSKGSALASSISSKIFQMPNIISEIPFKMEEGFKKMQMKGVYKRIDEATKILNEMEIELESQKKSFKDDLEESHKITNKILDDILDVIINGPTSKDKEMDLEGLMDAKFGEEGFASLNNALDSILETLSDPKIDENQEVDVFGEVSKKMYAASDAIFDKIKSMEILDGVDIYEVIGEVLEISASERAEEKDENKKFHAENSALLGAFEGSQAFFASLGVDITEELAAAREVNEEYYKYIKDRNKDADTKVRMGNRVATVTNFSNSVLPDEEESESLIGKLFESMLLGLALFGLEAYALFKKVKSFIKPISEFFDDIAKSGFFQTLKSRFAEFAKFADDFTGGFFSKMKPVLEKTKEAIAKPFIWVYEKIKSLSAPTMDSVKGWFSKSFEKIGGVFKSIANSKVGKFMIETFEAFKAVGLKVWPILKPFGKILSFAAKILNSVFLPLKIAVSMFDIFKGFSDEKALEAFGGIKSVITQADSMVVGLSTFVVEAISDLLFYLTGGIFNLIADFAFGDEWESNLAISFARFFDWIGTSMGDAFGDMVANVKDIFNSDSMWAEIGNAITNGMIWLVNAVPNTLNLVIDALASWASSIPGFSKIIPAHIPTIPYIETAKREAGGPLERDVATKVGEKGPEMIISKIDGLKVLNHNQTVQAENNLREIEKKVYEDGFKGFEKKESVRVIEKEKIIDKSGSVEEVIALTKKFNEYLNRINKPITSEVQPTAAQTPVVNNINNFSSVQTGGGKGTSVSYIHSGSIFDKLVKEF